MENLRVYYPILDNMRKKSLSKIANRLGKYIADYHYIGTVHSTDISYEGITCDVPHNKRSDLIRDLPNISTKFEDAIFILVRDNDILIFRRERKIRLVYVVRNDRVVALRDPSGAEIPQEDAIRYILRS